MNNLKLCDRSWIENFTTQCNASIKEFAASVCYLQDGLAREQQKSHDLSERCSKLETEVSYLERQLQLQQQSCKCQSASAANSSQNNLTKSISFNPNYKVKETEINKLQTQKISQQLKTKKNDCKAISSQPQEYGQDVDSPLQSHNNAMLSEQLQMDNSGTLSPGQHQCKEYSSETEYPITPRHWRISSKVQIQNQQQHKTSPKSNQKHKNENYGALEFVRANGRVGQTLPEETTHSKLREKNIVDVAGNAKLGKLNRKSSEWLSKEWSKSSTIQRGDLKRSKTYSVDDDHIFKKRSLLTLNKGSDRKLKQARLTQMQILQKERQNQEDISTFCEETASTDQLNNIEVDIFQCTDALNIESSVKDKTENLDRRDIRGSNAEVFPFSCDHLSDDESPSVVMIAPPTPTIICLKDSNDEADIDEPDDNIAEEFVRRRSHVPQNNIKSKVKIESVTPDIMQGQLLSEKVQTLCDDWEHDLDERDFIETKQPKKTTKKFSLKEDFSVECDLCENYIKFLGGNTLARCEIEKVLRSCMHHNNPNQNRFASPPNFWNPLMTTFSPNDPRNQTLLEDPVQRPKRSGM